MMLPRHPIKFQGWHILARFLIAYIFFTHAAYALLDPMSAAARAIRPLGNSISWVMAVQIIAATVVVWQAWDKSWREAKWAGIPWLILAACALMRLAGSVLTDLDSPFQSFSYVVLIVLCVFGAVNAARTT